MLNSDVTISAAIMDDNSIPDDMEAAEKEEPADEPIAEGPAPDVPAEPAEAPDPSAVTLPFVDLGEDTNILSYDDIFDVSEYAISAFQWACGADVIQGVDGFLLPKESASRAQIATLLMRVYEMLKLAK